MPRRVMQHLWILTHRFSATQTTIYGFNANGKCPMRKIKLKCQIGDLRSVVTCYGIDTDTSYNLLLGWSWIHHNSIVPLYSPSSHEVCWQRWKSLNIDRWKSSVQGGRELLHRFSPVPGFSGYRRESQPKKLDSGNEADVEPEAEEEYLWELNPLITSINKLDVNNTGNDVGEWYINEELDLAYFSVLAYNFVPSNTSTDVDDDS